MEGSGNNFYHWLMLAHHPFVHCSGFCCRSGTIRKRGESEKVCVTADVPASFKSGVLKHFGFPVVRNKKGERTENNTQTPLDDD